MRKISLAKIIRTLFVIGVAAFSAAAQQDWTIADYFKNLPEKYITTAGDFSKPAAETLFVDKKNGYAAQMDSPPGGNFEQFPVFEMALFKSQTKTPLVVVANRKSDSVCTDYETFFLRRVGNGWKEVSVEVLPAMNLKIFWDKPQSAAKFLKIVERENPTTYYFEPPRTGTRMKVSLKICDYFLEAAPVGQVDELTKIIASAKPVYLEWDKQNGKFKFAK